MKKHRMMIVGGTFDKNGGKTSYFIELIQKHFCCECQNGGPISELYRFRPSDIDILFWMPNVDNSEDKILPRLKVMNPKMILISSKRVIERKYSDYDLVIRAINAKANLCLIINKTHDYVFSVIDPLGNTYCDNYSLTAALRILSMRIEELLKVKRIGSQQVEFVFPDDILPINKAFIKAVQNYGTEFTKVIQANNPDRFLGNASTRCEFGFPSQRAKTHIYVSRRNVDKESITEENFVKAFLSPNRVVYYGNKKPSVDSPVQLLLYEAFPNINYMIHGHCYIEGAAFTENNLPCGDINEVDEIIKVASFTDLDFYTINLKGHGCIIMTQEVSQLSGINLISRPMLEK